MRKRIEQLARGKFEHIRPELAFSEEIVEFSVYEGTDYTGEFTIFCKNRIPIRGVVYSTNSRMECLTPQFEGKTVRIRYQFHSRGLSEGLTEKGKFVIVCNRTEISLSFCASVLRAYPQSSLGEIRSLEDFAVLADENREEAFRLFYHRNFFHIIETGDIREQLVYRGILASKPSYHNMEEFLVGIGRKDRIGITLEKQKYTFYEVKETIKETLSIHKDNWGFIELQVSSEGDFIYFEKTDILSDMFLGSVYPLEFYIDAEKLHDGKNYGQIRISSAYETHVVEIMASTREKHVISTIEKTYRSNKKKALARTMELYIAYRLKRIVTGVWTNLTAEILDGLSVMEPEESMYPLMKAQCLIINKQRQDAEWILDEFKRRCQNRKSPVWGYYLYVRSLMEKEPSFIERLTKEIEAIYEEHDDSALLYWVLLFLQEEYDDDAYKFQCIADYIMEGCSSPFFYVEAYYLLAQNPYLLTKLNEFEIRMLQWAMRHQAITKDIALQIFTIMENKKEFRPIFYQFLCAAYEIHPKPEHVGVICGYLIKTQQYDHRYHHWYEMGIELELRITGLYEAYLISMDERTITPVPKLIHKYFKYECAVPYKKLAVLYNNIIVSKEANMETYQDYQKTMSRFAMEQIEAGHMDDNLAVLYADMLDVNLIREESAKALAKIIFTCKLVVFDQRMVRAIIYQSQMKEPQIISIINQAAYFPLISKDYVILFEDEKGQRYAGGISYQLQKLMDAEKYMETCISYAPYELAYILSYFNAKQDYTDFVPEDILYLDEMMSSDKVSERYKANMLPKLLQFCRKQGDVEKLREYLKKMDVARLSPENRKYVMELLVENELYEMAYEKLAEYGIDQIGTPFKAALAAYMVSHYGDGVEDEFLTLLAMETFRAKRQDEVVLGYLCRYFQGSTKEMLSLWHIADAFAIQKETLSERLLTQMLYAEKYVAEGMPVFTSYCKAKGKEMLVLAYLSFCAQGYFVSEKKIKEELFALMETRTLNHCETNDACKLALLHHLSNQPQLTEAQFQIVDALLEEYTRRNMHFLFFKNFSSELQQKYHLYDKTFLEYRTENPNSHVLLHYSRDEHGTEFIKEEMQEVYEGIFVRAFVMFFGESIQYYISEEYENQVQVTECNRIINHDVYNKNDESRYSLLNQMLISNTLQEDADLLRSMKQYAEYEEITKTVFKLL
uniref:DUF5717 family protein n=1 Tax=Agathobacter sp. TaxID=2021311 RepID=UPI004055EAAF